MQSVLLAFCFCLVPFGARAERPPQLPATLVPVALGTTTLEPVGQVSVEIYIDALDQTIWKVYRKEQSWPVLLVTWAEPYAEEVVIWRMSDD